MTLCSPYRDDAVSVSLTDGPATPPPFLSMMCWVCMGGVRELAEPIEAVCEVPNEEACAKRIKMQMMKRTGHGENL